MGDNKEEQLTPTVCGSDGSREAFSSCDQSTELRAETQSSFVVNELLNAESRPLLQYLTSVASTDKSIDDEEYDAKIDQVLAQIQKEYQARHNQLVRQKKTLQNKSKYLRNRYFKLGNDHPDVTHRLLQQADYKRDKAVDIINLIKTLCFEKTELQKKLSSLRRVNPIVDITKPTNEAVIDDEETRKQAHDIIEKGLPVVPLKNIDDILKEETKGLLQQVLEKESLLPAVEHNATVDKLSTDILSNFNSHVDTLTKLKTHLQHLRNIFSSRARKLGSDNDEPSEQQQYFERARFEATKKKKEVLDHIVFLTKRKDALLEKVNAKLKPVPLSKSDAHNWHVQQNPAGSTQLKVTFEGQSATAIVVGGQKENHCSEELAFLKRISRLRTQEFKSVEKQKSLGQDWSERAHLRCYQLVVETEDILTTFLQPRIDAGRKSKFLNLLLEKYPPKSTRVEVTLSEADAAKINAQTLEIGGVSCQVSPVLANTTIVTTSDGGCGDEDERNFTRRLNTIIESELGSARTTKALNNYTVAKRHLCVASALIAKPAGIRELLQQLAQEPDTDIKHYGLAEELFEAKESSLLVDRIVAELRSQIEPPQEKNFRAPLQTPKNQNPGFLAEVKRCRIYFERQSLAEFLSGRQYSVFGNFLIAASKSILGCDLCEKGILLRHSAGEDLQALNLLLEKYRYLVPPDFAALKPALPPPRYTVPKKPPVQKPSPHQSTPAPKPIQTITQRAAPGPESGNLSVKQLVDVTFGLPSSEDFAWPSRTTQLSFRELRSLGLSKEQSNKFCKPPPKKSKKQSGNPNLTKIRLSGTKVDKNPKLKIHLSGTKVDKNPNLAKIHLSGTKERQLKEFNPELPHGFQKIKIPGQKNWYPPRFEPKQPNNMEGSSNQQMPVGDRNQGSNIVMRMLPGKKPAPPVAKQLLLGQPPQFQQQPSNKNQGQGFDRTHAPAAVNQSQGQANADRWREEKKIGRGNALMQYQDQLYPKGIPKSFLRQQNVVGQTPANKDNMPVWPTQSGFAQPSFTSTFTEAPSEASAQAFGQSSGQALAQHFTPGATVQDVLADEPSYTEDDEIGDGLESAAAGQKRLSAFQRLGPVAGAKKPKLTINLLFSKDDSVREVVDEHAKREKSPDTYVPVHYRQDILGSTDETVIKYLSFWPWKLNFTIKRTVGPRLSKSSMIMEEEQMIEGYESERSFVKVSVSKYPSIYKKEDVLDLVLETLSGKSFIPCFIEFTREECKFLVLRSLKALLTLHKKGLVLQENGVLMPVHISLTQLTLGGLGFIPRLVLGKRLTNAFDGESKLDLEAFCMQSDVSHFIYFPLNRPTNQAELMQLQCDVSWEYLREINLANNRLSTIEDFDFGRRCPKLRVLDLSHNHMERVTALLCCRGLPLRSLRLEGNPLCTDYTDPAHYVRVLRLMFPTLTELDGVKVPPVGELPHVRQNYCPAAGQELVDRFMQVYFPLLDSAPEDRHPIEELYHEEASLSITYNYKLRHQAIFRHFRDLFTRCRLLEEENLDSLVGASDIAKHMSRWPALKHDPYTFVIDVLHHDDATVVLRIAGVLKITSESLAEDEHVLAFSRTVVLHAQNGSQYRIHNEMLYWDHVTGDQMGQAFQITTVKPTKLALRMESAPDDDLKEKLIAIFMKLTEQSKKRSERCLEMRSWDFRVALEYFMKLLKLNGLDTLDVD